MLSQLKATREELLWSPRRRSTLNDQERLLTQLHSVVTSLAESESTSFLQMNQILTFYKGFTKLLPPKSPRQDTDPISVLQLSLAQVTSVNLNDLLRRLQNQSFVVLRLERRLRVRRTSDLGYNGGYFASSRIGTK